MTYTGGRISWAILFVCVLFISMGDTESARAATLSITNAMTSESYTEDTPLNLTDMVLSDSDGTPVTVTLTLSNPAAGSLSTATAGSVTSSYNIVTGVWTASGALASVNTLLAGLVFTPALNFNSDFTITVHISDSTIDSVSSKSMIGIRAPDSLNIMSITPDYGTANVPVDSPIVVTFSEPVATTSLQIDTSMCQSACGTFEQAWSANDTVVTLTRAGHVPFPLGTTIAFTILRADAVDGDGGYTNEGFWHFSTVAPYVLTEVTPVPPVVTGTTASYGYSAQGFANWAIHVDGCVGQISASYLGPSENHIYFADLAPGTYQCDLYTMTNTGTGLSAASNILQIGPFTVVAPQHRHDSGGGIHYGCKDPAASNYDEFAASKPELCVFGTKPSPQETATTTPATWFEFMKALLPQTTDRDVLELQKFLNAHGAVVADTGPGSPGQETPYFGALTQAALKRFQEKHVAEILTPLGLTSGTGIFGNATRSFVNSLK